MRWRRITIILCILAVHTLASCRSGVDLRVMTFNVRYPNRDDGENFWEKRKDLLVRVIRDEDPDLLGVQEAFRSQIDTILERLPGYAFVGTDRRGEGKDEYSAIVYRRDRFDILQAGTFWLSETPDVVASESWGTSLPRIVTWARLRERPSGREIAYFNTHFDHQSEKAREMSARLLRSRAAGVEPETPVIVTGDFNARPGSLPYRILLETNGGGVPLRDAWTLVPEPEGPGFTFHGFKGAGDAGARIDWILVGPGIEVDRAATINASDEGRYPSDHFPVVAHLKIR